MIRRLIKEALAGFNYLLTLAVSVLVVVLAVVVFRELVDDPGEAATATTTPSVATTAPAAAPIIATNPGPFFVCHRAAPIPDEGSRVIRLFYSCGDAAAPTGDAWVYRQVPDEGGILAQTMEQFVAGPTTEERADGFRSVFSPATSDAVISVAEDAGQVVVDLRDLGPLPSLKVDGGGAFFVAGLNNSLFQHGEIVTIEYRVAGSCDAFWAYLGSTECMLIDRAVWEADPGASGN